MTSGEHYLFVTGRLAEPALRGLVERLASRVGFEHTVCVLPIRIAALMSAKWVARRIEVPPGVTRVLLPGYCQGDLAPVEEAAGVPVERGPRDLRQLPDYFYRPADRGDYGDYDVEILAEIVASPRLARRHLLVEAERLEAQGADVVVLSGEAGSSWPEIGRAVRALRDQGRRVAIRRFEPADVEPAVRAGAELVIGVNRTNRRQARDWGCPVVVVPDVPGTLEGVEDTLGLLGPSRIACRIDPGLAPIGLGLGASLARYHEARRRWPDAEMLMALGDVTETTEVDSAAINVLLLGFCQELGIRSVLTAQGANWARSCVRECHLARRLVHYAVKHRVPPRRLDSALAMLRDPRLLEHGPRRIEQLAATIQDPSPRIFAEGGTLRVVAAGEVLEGNDPYDLFDQLLARSARAIEPATAFYLGYEMAKAVTALTLGKNYRQDEALEWGMLTVRELTRRERRALRMARSRNAPIPDCPESEEAGD